MDTKEGRRKSYLAKNYYNMHRKPIDQTPSQVLIGIIELSRIPKNNPVVDLACGYGRNGAYFAFRGFKTVFLDRNLNALDFIDSGIDVSPEGKLEKSHYEVFQYDLNNEWPFSLNSLAGVICVHFYCRGLIEKITDSIVDGGFLYFETIENRGMNYLELPRIEEKIDEVLKQYYEVAYINTRKNANGSQTITFLGYKKGLNTGLREGVNFDNFLNTMT